MTAPRAHPATAVPAAHAEPRDSRANGQQTEQPSDAGTAAPSRSNPGALAPIYGLVASDFAAVDRLIPSQLTSDVALAIRRGCEP